MKTMMVKSFVGNAGSLEAAVASAEADYAAWRETHPPDSAGFGVSGVTTQSGAAMEYGDFPQPFTVYWHVITVQYRDHRKGGGA
jgi:hypothetical protein